MLGGLESCKRRGGCLESQELGLRLGMPLLQEAAGLPWTAHCHEPVCPSGHPEGTEMMLFILYPAIFRMKKNTVERVSVLSKLSTKEKVAAAPGVRESCVVSARPAPESPVPPHRHPTVFPAKLYAVRNWESINNLISPGKISSVHFKSCCNLKIIFPHWSVQ